MGHTQTHQVQQCLDEVAWLRQRLGAPDWGAADWALLGGVLASYEGMLRALLEAQISVKRLLTLLFGKRRRRKSSGLGTPSADGSAAADHRGDADVGVDEAAQGVDTPYESSHRSSQDDVKPPPKGGHLPGYGRLGAGAYTGAERVECHHEELAVGQICPVCGQGRLYGLPPGVEIRIDGNALLSAMRYELEKLRCSACGEIFTARLSKDAPMEKYSARARAVLAVGRYYLGLPFYRIEGYQAMLGVPMPDATQWDLRHEVARVAVMTYETRT